MTAEFSKEVILKEIKSLQEDLNVDLCYDAFVKEDLKHYFYYKETNKDLEIHFETEDGGAWIKLKNFLQEDEEMFVSSNIQKHIAYL